MAQKEHPPTPRQILFKGKKILNERPEGMPYEVYKEARRHQTNLLNVLKSNPDKKFIPQRLGYNWHPIFPNKP